jgi:hypothetical protein
MSAVPLFISYAHEDQKWLDLLARHLASLENDGLIEVWDDRDIRAGSEKSWEAQLLPKLDSAGVILVLLSPNFANSRYCQKVELPRAIARKEGGEALVFFVLARQYSIEQSVSRFQILPSTTQSLKQIRDRDTALATIATQIRAALEDFHPASRQTPWSSPVVNRALPPYLPYLCNRTEQEDSLQLLCDEQATRSHRPLVFLLAGPHQECHEAFHERIARDLLPGLLGIPGATPADPLPLEWPADAVPGPGCDQIVSIRVARAAGCFGKDPAAILRCLPEGLIFLTTALGGDDWTSRDRDLVDAFLSYWNAWPDLAPNRALSVGISIIGERKGPSSAALTEAFRATSYPALRFKVLPNLKSPQEVHARNWLSHPKVKPWYTWELYRDPLRDRVSQIFAGRTSIPMRDLRQPLLEALQSCD